MTVDDSSTRRWLLCAGVFVLMCCFRMELQVIGTVRSYLTPQQRVFKGTTSIHDTTSVSNSTMTNMIPIHSVAPLMTAPDVLNQSKAEAASNNNQSNQSSSHDSDASSSSAATAPSFLRRTPMVLELLPWEVQSMHEYRNITRKKGLKMDPVCQPDDGISPSCCLGTVASGRDVTRKFADVCVARGPTAFQRVEEAARRALEQTNPLLLRVVGNDQHVDNDDCDVCRILDILDQHQLRFALTGDSVMLQTFRGLGCELARRGYHVVWNDSSNDNNATHLTRTTNDKVGIRSIRTMVVSGPDHWNQTFVRVTYLRQYQPNPDMSEISAMARKYDVVMMNFGLHWTWRKRNQYQATLAALFNATRHGKIQLLAHRETTAQHFHGPAGEWTIGSDNECVPFSNDTSLELPWRERDVRAGAINAGYKIVIANDVSLPQRKENDATKELVILPFYNFTVPLFDLHPRECTHFCSTPFLWMPIWRSLRLAMDRQPWTRLRDSLA